MPPIPPKPFISEVLLQFFIVVPIQFAPTIPPATPQHVILPLLTQLFMVPSLLLFIIKAPQMPPMKYPEFSFEYISP